MRRAIWYFDFISPFAYLCLHRLKELPPGITIEYRPVLFAGILAHWGQKGPAELPTKRRYTYRISQWTAKRLGVPFRYPAGHPFNPLHHLRLAIAAGGSPEVIRKIFDSIWTTGEDAADPRRYASLCSSLGVEHSQIGSQEVKDTLKKNTDGAIQRGVFGVPTFEIDGELFWGNDSVDFLKDYLKDPSVIRNAEMQRLDGLPVGAARRTNG